jgi:hypothetical protein
MTFPETGDTWKISWGVSKFRVNRETGEVDGSYQAGLVAGGAWGGFIGDATSVCQEADDDGNMVTVGPVTIHGGSFHYELNGSLDGDTLTLNAPSKDAQVSLDAPPDDGCQFMKDIAQGFMDYALQNMVFVFEIPANQDEATYQVADDNQTFTATIKRTPLVQP